jgi:hypothetical protein
MSKTVTLLCPLPSDRPDIHVEAGHVFWDWDHGQEDRRVTSQLLDRFTAIVDESSLLSFVRQYGFIQPMHARNPDATPKFHAEPAAPSILEAARFKEMRESLRNPKWGTADYIRAATHLQEIVTYCRLSPSIDFDRQLLTFRVGVTDTPTWADDSTLPLTCALSVAVHFLLEEFARGARSDAPVVECANPECRRRFRARRRPVAGGRAWCDRCRGSAAMWRTNKQEQRGVSRSG